MDSSKQAINHSINQGETRNKRNMYNEGRSAHTERQGDRHAHGAHTNDKHAQGDEIKILGGRLGGWDIAIGGLRLVIVGRDTRLRGRLGRHDGKGGGLWTKARNASCKLVLELGGRVRMCMHNASTAGWWLRRVVAVAVYDELARGDEADLMQAEGAAGSLARPQPVLRLGDETKQDQARRDKMTQRPRRRRRRRRRRRQSQEGRQRGGGRQNLVARAWGRRQGPV